MRGVQKVNSIYQAGKGFKAGDFVVEYRGKLLSLQEAKKIEADYQNDHRRGSYMFFFTHGEQKYW